MKFIRRLLLIQMLFVLTLGSFAQAGSLKNGATVPEFSIISIDNSSTYTASSLKGKVYLIDFWATWCAPCVRALPHLQKVYDQYKDKGFTIVSLSMDQTPAAVSAFRKKKFPMPWNHAFVKGGLESESAQAFKVTGLPAAILVDRNGKIIAMNKELEGEKLDKLLAAEFAK